MLFSAAPPSVWADSPADDSATLVLAVPLEGPLARFGQSAVNGAELALSTLGGGFGMTIVDESTPLPDDLSFQNVPVIAGYFTESRLAEDAPRYIYLKKAVLLPFITTKEGAALGPENFFRLMPTSSEQGEYLAMQVLTMKKRPRRILIIAAPGETNSALAETFTATLAAPIQPPEPPATPGKRAPKKTEPIKPLDKNAQVVTIDQEADLTAIPEFAKNSPELIIVAVNPPAGIELAPRLGASKFSKVPVWGGTSLGFREVGAAFESFRLNLSLALPVDLSASGGAVKDFRTAYINEYKIQPTWIAALAYDSINLAIKAVSSTAASGNVAAFLNGNSHHALGTYELAPGGGGRPPLAMMAIKTETLGYLP
ncbi:hypothetical protein C4J81_07900 [Deltaproteobacteria bacterium Smac51]|nr:hypothetical protein C4J81_07900 [Deltaproteobacteria bacterium Smac51]